MRIALVYPRGNKLPKQFNGIVDTRPKKSLLPLGALSIVANSTVQIDFVDNRVQNLNNFDLSLKLLKYGTVGFSGTLFESRQAVLVSRMLRQHGVFTIYGGANATVNYKDYLDDFDQIVIGEADNYDFSSREKIVRLPRKKKLDDLSYPARDVVNLDDYNRHERWLDFPTDTVVSSRGCPYTCSFCASNVIWGKTYTMRSAKSVLDEVIYLQQTCGTNSIYFREDNFTVSKKRLRKICKGMNIGWKCESRVDAIDDETAKMMAGGGCKSIWFGIEHTSDKILNTVSKGTDYATTLRALEACEKYGIKTVGSFIVGLPEESLLDMVKNAIKIRKLKLNHVSINRAYAFPKSEMWSEILKENLDAFSHNGIILPRTKHVTKKVVDLMYIGIKKYLSL